MFFSYFASQGFTYGSSSRHWLSIQAFAHQHSLIFVPSVGPGYDDTRVRPWNAQNIQERGGDGEYYRNYFEAILRINDNDNDNNKKKGREGEVAEDSDDDGKTGGGTGAAGQIRYLTNTRVIEWHEGRQ